MRTEADKEFTSMGLDNVILYRVIVNGLHNFTVDYKKKKSSVCQTSESNFVEIFYVNETMNSSLTVLFQKFLLRCLPTSSHAYVVQ